LVEPRYPRPPLVAEPDEAATIKQLAVTGVATTFGRSVGVRAIGLLLNLVLARILAPADFGQLALGLTVFTAFSAFANAGLGATLVRRAKPPEPDDLSTVFAAQLWLGIFGLTIVATLALFLEAAPLVLAALFLSGLPILAPRTAIVIQLERRLDYKRLAIIDVIDCFSQAVFALGLVLAGMGVYGVALAQPLGLVVGTLVLLSWRVAPVHRPRFVRDRARSLFGDGALFGASDATNLARELTINWGTAAIAGVSVLGIWSFTMRLAAIPLLVIQALGQVTYSAVPRLHAAGGSAKGVVAPILRLTAIGLGIPVLLLGGCSPQFIPLVLGSEWTPITDALPLTCLAILVAGPISVASTGYLFSQGRVRRILAAQIAHSLVALGLAFTLLPHLGVTALAIAACGASMTDVAILGTATLKGSYTGYLRTTAPLVLCTVALGAGSFTWAQGVPPSWPSLFLIAGATLTSYGLALFAVARDDSRRLWRLFLSARYRSTAPA
jgi:O-antigen/teichoic acid export membrane protein